MVRISNLLTIVFFLFALNMHAQEKKQKINYEKEGYVKAIVIDYKVDGCGFLLELSDAQKTKLTADNLTEEFKKDQQKIWVKYTPKKNQLPSTCMAGKQVEITAIKKRR